MNSPQTPRHPSDRDLFELAEGELPTEHSKPLWGHVAGCPQCRQRFTEWTDAQRMVAAVSVTDVPGRVMVRVRQRLEEAARSRQPAWVRWAPVHWAAAVAAAAALLLVVFGLHQSRQRAYHAPQGPGRIARPEPSVDWGSASATASAPGGRVAGAPGEARPAHPSGRPPETHAATGSDAPGPPTPRTPQILVTEREFVAGTGPASVGGATPPAGRPLGPGELLRTGDTDRALIELPDGGQMVVGFDTELKVAKAASLGGESDFSVKLEGGEVWAWSPGDGGKITVVTAKGSSRLHHGAAIVRLYRPETLSQAPGRAPLRVVALAGRVQFTDASGHLTALRPGQVLLADRELQSLQLEAKAFERVIEVRGGWGKRRDAWQIWPLSRADLLSQLDLPRLSLGAEFTLGPEEAPGLQVASVVPGSNAAQAGLRPGDRLLRIGGRGANTLADIAVAELRLAGQGDRMVTVRRDGRELSLELPDAVAEASLSRPPQADLREVAARVCDNDIGGAAQICLRLAGEQSSCAGHWYNLALLRQYQGRLGASLAAHKKAGSLQPDSPPILTALARAYARVGNLTRARARALEADAIRPSGSTRYLLGRVAVLDNDFGETERWSNILLQSESDRDIAWGELLAGQLAYIRSDHARARRCFENARLLDPANLRATYYLAAAHKELLERTEARRLAESLLGVWPDLFAALNLMGDLAYRAGDWPAAESWFTRALDVQPGSPAVLCNRGYASLGEGNYDDAIGYYEQAISADPSFIPAHAALAEAALETGRLDLAAQHYEKALRLNPGSEKLLNSLVGIYEDQGDSERVQSLRRRYDLSWAAPE